VLAVAGDKAQITMVGGGKVIGYVPEVPEASLSGVTAMRFSADSKRLAIGCANRALHIRDLRSQVGRVGAEDGSITTGARGSGGGRETRPRRAGPRFARWPMGTAWAEASSADAPTRQQP
jgi:hypothetical protein